MSDFELETTIRQHIAELETENERLKEALMDAVAHLAGAVSAYETFAGNSKRAGVRDALYNTRSADFRRALERTRGVLLELYPK